MENKTVFQQGETVIEEGAKGTSAFIILSGEVEIIKRSGEKELAVAKLGQGQVFGEMGLIEDRPRSATVRASSELKVRVIDREQFNELLRTKPSVLIPIMKSLFERLRQVSDMLAERAMDSSSEPEKEFEVIMEGQTEEAKKVLNKRKLLITKFPFLIGRDSPIKPETDVFYNNDLTINEEKPYKISRNHLAINKEGGNIWAIDRGSSYGTIVNGKEIGGESGLTRTTLDEEQNQLILGPVTSKFIFLINIKPV